MNEKKFELGWLILAILAAVLGGIQLFKGIETTDWIILAILCYLISLQHYKIRKSEEV